MAMRGTLEATQVPGAREGWAAPGSASSCSRSYASLMALLLVHKCGLSSRARCSQNAGKPYSSHWKRSEISLRTLSADEKNGKSVVGTSRGVGVSQTHGCGLPDGVVGHFIRLLQEVREGVCGYLGSLPGRGRSDASHGSKEPCPT